MAESPFTTKDDTLMDPPPPPMTGRQPVSQPIPPQGPISGLGAETPPTQSPAPWATTPPLSVPPPAPPRYANIPTPGYPPPRDIPVPGVSAPIPTPTTIPSWQRVPLTRLYDTNFPQVAQVLMRPESGGRNVREGTRGNVPGTGPASGYFQIEDATWRDFAPKIGAGQWATAMDAPPQVQWAVAQQIPLGRWTAGKDAILKAYPWARPDMTIGQIATIAANMPAQQYIPAAQTPGLNNRPVHQWGTVPEGGYPQGPGHMPSLFDIPRVMAQGMAFLPLLSMFTRGGWQMAATGFAAYVNGYQNGQILKQQMAQNEWQNGLAETIARQEKEFIDAQDAFATYGADEDGLSRALYGVASKYGDNAMIAALNQGGSKGVEALEQKRDAFFTDLNKVKTQQQRDADLHQAELDRHEKALQDQADNATINADAASRYRQMRADPANTNIPDAQLRGQALGAARRDFNAAKTGAKEPTPARPGTVDAMMEDWIKQQRAAGHEPTVEEQAAERGRLTQVAKPPSAAQQNLEVSKLYDIVDDKGDLVQGGVELRERKDKAGFVHSETGEPLELQPGQHVKQTTPTTTTGGRAGAQTLRQTIGGREVLSDLQNIGKLRVGTTIGPLGTVHAGPTIGGAVTGDLVRKMTDQESQLMQASLAGVGRELSTLMSPVYGGRWASETLDPLIPKSGDTLGTVMFKIARIKQTADNALEGLGTAPWLTPEQKKYAVNIRQEMDKAIKWDTTQALEFATRGQKGQTFNDFVESGGMGTAPRHDDLIVGHVYPDANGNRAKYLGVNPSDVTDPKNWEAQ